MNKVFPIFICLALTVVGCRRTEQDVQQYFRKNQSKFDALVKASLSKSGSIAKENLMKELDVVYVNTMQSGCDTTQNYDQVSLQMDNEVYIDGMLWGSSYHYVYSICPCDSFHYSSNNTTSGWLSPHWSYYVEKGL